MQPPRPVCGPRPPNSDLVALGLIVVLPSAFVYTFLFLANTVGIALLEWANERPYTGEFYVGPILLTVVVLGGLGVQYRLGPRTVLGSVGARDVDASEYPDLHAAVTRLSSQMALAKPGVAVSGATSRTPSPSPERDPAASS